MLNGKDGALRSLVPLEGGKFEVPMRASTSIELTWVMDVLAMATVTVHQWKCLPLEQQIGPTIGSLRR